MTQQRKVARLTGPKLDRITSVVKAVDNIYTSSRDGKVKVYSIADMII